MTIYVPGKLTLRQTYIGVDDPDAADYIAAVEAADEIASPGIGGLETATKVAIHSFVKGCKADGIWPAIKASCILAGARTLAGALTPLVGTAPTNVNFVAGDYNRETGLKGDGSTKYLNSNRANNADPQNSRHVAVWASTAGTTSDSSSNYPVYIGSETGSATGRTIIHRDVPPSAANMRTSISNATAAIVLNAGSATGMIGLSRAASSSYTLRVAQQNTLIAEASETPSSANLGIYRTSAGSIADQTFNNARLGFYSIGESLDLALLDARVTDLMNAIGAAIP